MFHNFNFLFSYPTELSLYEDHQFLLQQKPLVHIARAIHKIIINSKMEIQVFVIQCSSCMILEWVYNLDYDEIKLQNWFRLWKLAYYVRIMLDALNAYYA